jgi:hypothetical protein
MVKSIRVTVQADFLSQFRTMKVSDKTRKQVAAFIASQDTASKRLGHDSAVEASNNIRVVEHSSKSTSSTDFKLHSLHSKKIRFDEAFFDGLLNHLEASPSDGSFIPSRRHVLRNILHSKMADGFYPAHRSSANGLSWEDFDHLVLSLLTLRSLVSSSVVEGADSSFDDLKASMDQLTRKIAMLKQMSADVCHGDNGGWCLRIEGQPSADTEFVSGGVSLKGVDMLAASKQVRAFSTAPVWYQQGMENGPPQQQSRQQRRHRDT